MSFASRNATRLSSRSALRNRSYLALLVSEGMLGIPVGLYLYVFHRDWSFMYLVDGRHIPSAVAVAILAAFPVVATGGYMVGIALLRARRDAVLGALVAIVALTTILAGAVFRNRVLLVGTYGGYHGGYGMRGLGQSTLGPVAGLLSATLLVGWAYVVWRSARESRPPGP